MSFCNDIAEQCHYPAHLEKAREGTIFHINVREYRVTYTYRIRDWSVQLLWGS